MSCSVHDVVDLEMRGIPAVFTASEPFRDGAQAQASALGMPGVRRVFTPHPIQDRSDDEIRAYADRAIDALIEAITDTAAP